MLTRQRPHTVLVAGIQQENRHLRELQQENRELRAALEEHQNALELIMSKYRQQVAQLVASHKLDLPTIHSQKYAQIIEEQADKISEMAAVMERAAAIDEREAFGEQELISKLVIENKGLRELLQIACKNGSLQNGTKAVDKEVQTDETVS
ncbi:unnamed protein product [Timema podura]|uniref:FGFR1 oncogene partner 2 n=1 Tax=Timema podura TaxID=61482 RepID=A0ABN7P809_TIMPD|nr:unnamed protein product [Timema podura]